MGISFQNSQGLVDLLSRSLRQAPARAGLRLRPERELAAALGIGRRRVALAVNKLAEQGVLVRRVGSGTYLRHVPLPAAEGVRHGGKLISPADLFSGQASSNAERDLKIARQLKLGVAWGALSEMTRANRLVLDGMIARAQELDHVLTVHPFDVGSEGWERTKQTMARQHFDGLLLCAMHFIKERLVKVARVLGQAVPPHAYFYSADAPTDMQPAVMIHASDAARQAVANLAGQGWRRIGLVSLRPDLVSTTFDAALRDAGLEPCAAGFAVPPGFPSEAQLTELDIIRAGRRCTAELLSSAQPPDALYVADDVMMMGVAEVLSERRVVPGRDIGVISLANVGGPVPPAHDWSRLLVDPANLGRLAVDLIVSVVQRDANRPPPGGLRLDALWHPGETHLRPR